MGLCGEGFGRTYLHAGPGFWGGGPVKACVFLGRLRHETGKACLFPASGKDPGNAARGTPLTRDWAVANGTDLTAVFRLRAKQSRDGVMGGGAGPGVDVEVDDWGDGQRHCRGMGSFLTWIVVDRGRPRLVQCGGLQCTRGAKRRLNGMCLAFRDRPSIACTSWLSGLRAKQPGTWTEGSKQCILCRFREAVLPSCAEKMPGSGNVRRARTCRACKAAPRTCFCTNGDMIRRVHGDHVFFRGIRAARAAKACFSRV